MRVEVLALGGVRFIGGVQAAVVDESTPPAEHELPGTPESRERARKALARD